MAYTRNGAGDTGAALLPWDRAEEAESSPRPALTGAAALTGQAALTGPNRKPPGGLSRLPVARSLTEATPRTLVSLDSRGQVRSPVRRLAERMAAYGALGVMASMTLVSASLGDPLGMTIGMTATAMWAHGVLVARWLEQASALMVHGQLDRAEALLRRCLLPPWGSHSVRAHAHLRLSGVATRRGDHGQALLESQQAIALFEEERPRQGQFLQVARYQEVRALVSSGRLADARVKLEDLGGVPDGDYLRMQHYVTELYVALSDGRMPFGDGPLWERTHMALRLSAAAPLLALCSWGYFKLGELDMAWHLLQTAYERLEGEPLPQMMPLLWRWMEARRRELAALGPRPQPVPERLAELTGGAAGSPGDGDGEAEILDAELVDSAERSGAPSIDSAERSAAPSIDSAERSGAPSIDSAERSGAPSIDGGRG